METGNFALVNPRKTLIIEESNSNLGEENAVRILRMLLARSSGFDTTVVMGIQGLNTDVRVICNVDFISGDMSSAAFGA